MKIGIIGTGIVGRTLGGKLLEKGHEVVFGTRDVAATMARAQTDGMRNPPFAEWMKSAAGARLATFADAAAHGQVVINATSGMVSLSALKAAGANNLAAKILIDVSNPLDFSKGFPPTLSVCNTESLAEQIQSTFPETKVVKTLNTLNAILMVNPSALPGDHTIFVNGNDSAAKQAVITYLHDWYGWKASNIIDMGDITTARGTEMLLPIWVRLYGVFQSPMFNFHIVRA